MNLGGVAAGITQGLQDIQGRQDSQDTHAYNLLAIQQLQNSIKQQDVQATAQNALIATAAKMPTIQFDDAGNPIMPQANSPVAGMPMPGQMPQVPPNTVSPGQTSQPMQPPPRVPGMPPPQMGPQGAPPAPANTPAPMNQMPAPAPIPPYVDVSKMQPPQQPTQGPMMPPSMQPTQGPMSPEDQIRANQTVSQAKAMLIPDEAFKQLFEIQPTSTEKQIAAYKKAFPQAPYEAILYKLGFNGKEPLKEARDQINAERNDQDKVKARMATAYNKSRDLGAKKEKDTLSREGNVQSDNLLSAQSEQILQGMPRSQIVASRGKEGSAEYNRAMDASVKKMVDAGMTASEAGEFIAKRQQEYKAGTSVRTATEKRATGLDIGLSEVKNDIATLTPILDKFGSNFPTAINKPINILRRQGSSPELAQLDLAAKTVATKYERALSGGLLSVAQLHAGAQEDSKKLLNGDMSIAEMKAKLPLMIKEIDNSIKASHDTLDRNSSKSVGKSKAPAGGSDLDKLDAALKAAGF